MADQRDDAVRKGAHCAWQIHYHIVFPVKYRKALFDEAVTTIIQETAAEIAERFPIEMEAIGTDQNHRGGEFWTDGYYVATVGERANWQTVERYVQRQGQPREDLRQLRMF